MSNNGRIRFKSQSEYKIGAVTYHVTAHFLTHSHQDTLKSKIAALLNKEICNKTADIIASSQSMR
ncbi:hypothetical protein [Oscillibacter sp. GMB15532]|uniref:hypothetical protein n=1 Tax=Oscillibacter sp. GMB15532 TaxID=3230022 RepID=UPI0034DECEE3